MKRFEYTRHILERAAEPDALRHYGESGWELVAVVPSLRTEHDKDATDRWARWAMYYFKRALP